MKDDDINKWSWSVLEQYCKDDSTDVDFNEYEVSVHRQIVESIVTLITDKEQLPAAANKYLNWYLSYELKQDIGNDKIISILSRKNSEKISEKEIWISKCSLIWEEFVRAEKNQPAKLTKQAVYIHNSFHSALQYCLNNEPHESLSKFLDIEITLNGADERNTYMYFARDFQEAYPIWQLKRKLPLTPFQSLKCNDVIRAHTVGEKLIESKAYKNISWTDEEKEEAEIFRKHCADQYKVNIKNK